MAAGLVADAGLLVAGQLVEVLEDFVDRLVSPFGALEQAVGGGHVGLMVLVVVQVHRLLVDGRRERVVVVRQRRNFVGHRLLLA